jgi:hypothetical protein
MWPSEVEPAIRSPSEKLPAPFVRGFKFPGAALFTPFVKGADFFAAIGILQYEVSPQRSSFSSADVQEFSRI